MARNLVTGLWRQVERSLLKRELVGIDLHGNHYFRVWSKDEAGEQVEKRICKPTNTDPSEYTPESMPPEWSSWLRRQRRDPPTEEEIAKNNAARAVLQQRVAVLQAEDTKRRLQAEARGGYQQAAAQPDLGRFLEQMTKNVQEDVPHSNAADTPHAPGSGAAQPAPPTGKKESYQPGAWVPGAPPPDS